MLKADPNPFTPNRQSSSASLKTLKGLRQGLSVLVLVLLGHWLIKPLFQPAIVPSLLPAATVVTSPYNVVSAIVSHARHSDVLELDKDEQASSAALPTSMEVAAAVAMPVSTPSPVDLESALPTAKGMYAGQTVADIDLNVETTATPTLTLAALESLESDNLSEAWDAPGIKPLIKTARKPITLSLAGGVQTIDFTQVNAFQLGFRAEKSLNASLSIISGLNWNRQFFGQLEYAGEALFEAANPNLPGHAVKPGNVPVEYIRSNSFQVDLIQLPLEIQYKSARQLWKASAGLSIGLPIQVGYSSGTTLQEKQLFDDRARQGLTEGIAKRFFTATVAFQVPVHENLEMEVRGNLGLNDISNDAYMGIHDAHTNKGIQLGLIWKY